MDKSQKIEIVLKPIIFAHHYGYRVVAAYEGAPPALIKALEVSAYHQYFLERKPEEAHRPVKFRYFTLEVEQERYYVLARLDAVPDVITHRGLVSFVQFYLIAGQQHATFEHELQANITFLKEGLLTPKDFNLKALPPNKEIAAIPLITISIDVEEIAAQLQQLQNSRILPDIQRLCNEDTFQALEKGQKVFIYSEKFTDSVEVFNVYCCNFIAAMPVIYRREISFSTSELTTRIKGYEVVFLHSAATIDVGKLPGDIKLVSLDEPVPASKVLWYLDAIGPEQETHDFQVCHRFLSERLVHRSFETLKGLKTYFDFLQKAQKDGDLFKFKGVLGFVKESLGDLNGGQIARDLREVVAKHHSKNDDVRKEINESLQEVLTAASEKQKDYQFQAARYVAGWCVFFADQLSGSNRPAWISNLMELFEQGNKANRFACEALEELARLSPENKKLNDFICQQFIFTGKQALYEPASHKEIFELVQQAIRKDETFKNFETEIKIQEELLKNLNILPAPSKSVDADGDLMAYSTPEFEQGFSKLTDARQNEFYENLCGFIENSEELKGVLLPVLWSYLQKPDTRDLPAAERCFEKMVVYLENTLPYDWQSDQYEQIVELCLDMKPYALSKDHSDLAKIYLLQIAATTQSKESRIDKLLSSILTAKFKMKDREEVAEVYFEHFVEKDAGSDDHNKTVWQEKLAAFLPNP